MIEKDSFERICEQLGIEFIGTAGGGEEKVTPTDKQAFLASWGMEIPAGQTMKEAAEALVGASWQQIIDRVSVVGEDRLPLEIVVRLPRMVLASGQPVRWRLAEENGLIREGVATPADLAILAEAEIDGTGYVALQLRLVDCLPPPGYHHIRVEIADAGGESRSDQGLLIITPGSCYLPRGLEHGARVWGLSCHLATLRSRRNWGIGDLTDLQNVLCWAAENGAGTVAVSSLLAKSLPQPGQLYPDLPSSRHFLDPLYLDLEAVADFDENGQVRALTNDPAFQVRLAGLRESDQVEYAEVAALKRMIAEALWQSFQHNHLNPETERGGQFRRFQQTGGPRLQAFALYEAWQDQCLASVVEGGGHIPPPQILYGPDSPEIAAFGREARERIEYHQYIQWQLELQLSEVGKRSMELGLKVGLSQSLAAGVAANGFDVWYTPSLFAKGIEVCDSGEQGDCYPFGPPVLPAALTAIGYEPFIAMLRFNMRHAGALCLRSIDMLERQLWLTGSENDPNPTIIVRRFADLLGIIALESWRNRCLVIGEHRGALDDRLAKALGDKGVFISRPGFFQKNEDEVCLEPSCSPSRSVVIASRYDLSSLASFWQGRDLVLLSALCPRFTNERREKTVIARATDRAYLLVALNRQNLLPPETELDPAGVPTITPALGRAVFNFLARSPAQIFLVSLVDLPVEAEEETVFDEQVPAPVWRRRLPIGLEGLVSDEALHQLFREFCRERGLGVVRPSAPLADRKRQQQALIPQSFYRLQFSRDFTFLQAAALVPYLKDLGISHCYASPYLKARPGSCHGYDIIDHSSLNPEIGSREDYEAFVTALDLNGMAQIIDMVPNHMGVGPDNRWWVDVLENGRASPFADFFDINWQSQEEELKNRILLPMLGDSFGTVLEEGKLRLVFLAERGSFAIAYYENLYPLAPATYPHILGHDLQRLAGRIGSQDERLLLLQNLCTSFANIAGAGEITEEIGREEKETRARNKEVLKRLLARLCREAPEVSLFIEENLIYFNGEPGRPKSFDPLEKLLAQQVFRLAFWRVASDEINYRRFFDINDLAGIRMERREVFAATHALVLDLIATGKIDGLRIDHPDGLYDPGAYFRTLQEAAGGQWPLESAQQSRHDRQAALPLYIVAEKILTDGEQLPDDWLVHGTSGYDFGALVNGLFVDQSAEDEITTIYQQFIGRRLDFAALVHDSKRRIIKTAMAGEINVLCAMLHRLAKKNRYTQDYTFNSLREALIEIVAFFPVYRTYCTAESLSENDRRQVAVAVDRARNNQEVEDTGIFEFIKSVLLLEGVLLQDEAHKQESVDFVMKFQQYTGPVMAKGMEDTVFFIYNRLLSLNEVGSDPRRFGVSVAEFHAANQARNERWPFAMLNTSTHDSKRSEDVRARINVLSEMPSAWREALERWSRFNRAHKTPTGRGLAPSANDEYAIYQNLLGVWPVEEMTGEGLEAFSERFTAAMVKAAREAKVHTSWAYRHDQYESGLEHFIAELLKGGDNAFFADFKKFHKDIDWFGAINSLSQLLLKLTSPGVPDIYQGNEVWNFSLVDPDNRRPVDFEQRRGLLAELKNEFADASVTPVCRLRQYLLNPGDGRIKMYLLWKTLACRRENAELFERARYVPLAAKGAAKDHLCVFAREHHQQVVIMVVPRLVVRLLHGTTSRLPVGNAVWRDTAIPLAEHWKGRTLRNIYTGEEVVGGNCGMEQVVCLSDIFASFPYALLILD